MNIGFSTGSLAYSDFNKGIQLLNSINAPVIELSALREKELVPLLDALPHINLSMFKYISFHAPSKLMELSENDCVKLLIQLTEYNIPIIVHPDIIANFQLWRTLGSHLCIENMDKRKPIGRTSIDLEYIFSKLPNATFCLDVAHARQVDPTMTEAKLMLKYFRDRLIQLHVSDVNSNSRHEALNLEAILAYRKINHLIPRDIPIILESPVPAQSIQKEITSASLIFDDKKLERILLQVGITDNFQSVPA